MEIITQLGLLAFAGAFIWMQWKNGGNKAQNDTIQIYKDRDEAREKQIVQFRKDIASFTEKIGRLTGQLEEKDKRIVMLEAVLQNRNPELERSLKDIADSLGNIKRYMESSEKMDQKVYQILELVHKEHALIIRKKNGE